MTPEEITAHCNGKMLKSSLEIYAPLSEEEELENLAQSTNTISLTDDGTGIVPAPRSTHNAGEYLRYYTLSGQALNKARRGMNIVEGKKLLVK